MMTRELRKPGFYFLYAFALADEVHLTAFRPDGQGQRAYLVPLVPETNSLDCPHSVSSTLRKPRGIPSPCSCLPINCLFHPTMNRVCTTGSSRFGGDRKALRRGCTLLRKRDLLGCPPPVHSQGDRPRSSARRHPKVRHTRQQTTVR